MRKLGVGLAVIGLSIPAFLHAMGLGEISVNSYLNQPLAAEIQLVSTSPSEVDTLQVNIAPDKIFQQIGIERVGLLNQLNFEPVIKNGVPVIQITSNRPITEPFLNFVIEVAWPKGRLLREYTVLLDPPVFRQQQAPAVTAPAAVAPQPEAVESVAEPVEPVAPMPTEPVEVAEPVQPSAPVQTAPIDEMADIPLAETFPISESVPVEKKSAPVAAAETVPVDTPDATVVENIYTTGGDYEVQRGDTLWEIADSHRPADVGVQQMMIALLRENPKAFMGANINRLKRGYILRMPDSTVIDDISRRQARAEVKKQHTLWEQYRKQLAAAAVPQQAAMDSPAEQAPEAKAEEAAEKEEVAKEEAAADEAQVAEQKSDTKESELEIVVPKEGGEEDATAGEGTVLADATAVADLEKEVTLAKEQVESQSRENEELRSRVSELEALLTDKDRMIQLKDEQLLDIQQKLGDIEKAVQIPEPAEVEPEVVKPAEEATPTDEPPAEEAQTEDKSPEVVASESDELMPRIPLDAPEVTMAETETPAAETDEGIKEEVGEAKEEIIAAISDTTTEPVPETALEEPVVEEKATEAMQTASLDSTVEEEENPSFFSDLLRNPNLIMGAGFGALLLLGLGWLAKRRKSSAELEIPAMAEVPEVPDYSAQVEVVEDEISDAEQAAGGMLDFTDSDDETEFLTEDEAKDDLDDLIETAFESNEVAVEADVADDNLVDEIESLTDLEPRDEVKGSEIIGSAFGRTEDLVEDELEPLSFDEETGDEVDISVASGAGDFKDIIAEEFPESDEVLAEADVYLAYGLNEQAVDLLKPALLEQPARADYRGKLLEALYAMEDKQAFLDEATELKDQLGDSISSSSVWERVAAMGKDVAPESDLFDIAESSGISLEDIAHKKPEPIDIDLGSDDFNESDLLDDEMKETVVRGEGTAHFDAPGADISEIAFQDTQAIDPADMGLALEGLDIIDDDPDSAETVMLDDRTVHGLELGSLGGDGNAAPSDATNEFKFDASDLDNLDTDLELDTDASQEIETASDESNIEVDDGFAKTEVLSRQENIEAESDEEKTEMDEDVLSASMEMTQVIDVDGDLTSETDMSETDLTDLDLTKDTLAMDMLDEGEGEIPLLSGEDEIDTKLDLAKAYLDMGDEEGAKDALDEVMSTGSEQQKTEAQRLLNQLG